MVNNIAFPGLGLSFDIDRVAFYIGSKPIYWYGILIAAGFAIALLHLMAVGRKRGIKSDNIYDIAIYGLIFGIIGARIYYIIFDFDSVRGNILNIFAVWKGGLAIYGGIIGGVISTFVYCRKKNIPFFEMSDLFVRGLFIGQAVGRWGNFFNTEVYGRKTDIFCRMSINGADGVHPLFLYESLWNIIGFLLLIVFDSKLRRHRGESTCFYAIWYGIGRIVIESMRDNRFILYLIGPIGISHVVSAVLIIAGIVFMYRLRKSEI